MYFWRGIQILFCSGRAGLYLFGWSEQHCLEWSVVQVHKHLNKKEMWLLTIPLKRLIHASHPPAPSENSQVFSRDSQAEKKQEGKTHTVLFVNSCVAHKVRWYLRTLVASHILYCYNTKIFCNLCLGTRAPKNIHINNTTPRTSFNSFERRLVKTVHCWRHPSHILAARSNSCLLRKEKSYMGG